MDFSSADIPISRETWAPQSPARSPLSPPSGSAPPPHAAPASGPPRSPPSATGSNYERSSYAPRGRDDSPGRYDGGGRGREYESNGSGGGAPHGSGPGPYVPPYRQGRDFDR
ncbi:hypothetical protein DB88DRAFT_472728 [Papiliotrema laurentii]|uniref:Uncharacterized protein n=1 Tax=Papiliotrema laurentii TaxID=5418 RepID=A0AAD9CXZ8_PAPLA|nr:hypothetical protein DB88DRAFT_472728 [Papiliotrema laurentii]